MLFVHCVQRNRFRAMDRYLRRPAPKPVEVAAAAAPQRGASPEAEADSNNEASSVEGDYSDITGLLSEIAKEPAFRRTMGGTTSKGCRSEIQM